MQYTKPVLVKLASAVDAVRGMDKENEFPPDSKDLLTTPSAYEADE